ncbi:hypothetical protein GCM10008955_10270 [Deinococcus malanensis]|uniref:Uncharacterized protein n=1 Tax=Deinococcus malanensis TaxID=1706855 RepID=A0ABQ2ENH4_9DEIO|nr:hypothetical protein GCM10008955_10270 [Deinococcus malanensis]
MTSQVLHGCRLNTDHLRVKGTAPPLKPHFSYVITRCDCAQLNYPSLPFAIRRGSWWSEDPAGSTGADEDRHAVFWRVSGQIESRIMQWVGDQS